jgi:6-phospho-beta-glucosidase
MKVTVLGGSSFSTPALFQEMHGEFAGCEFALAGRSERRLHTIARAARYLAGAAAPAITPVACDARSSRRALAGAEVVLIQMRIGNLPGRRFDESFPLRFDLCGDEGLGAGGVSAAWRSWPVMEAWLQAIVDHAPRALVLMMSSPVGVLTRAARMRFPSLNCLGVCEVPYLALKDLAALLDVPLPSVQYEYVGVNHIGWLYAVRSQDRDLAREWADHPLRRGFPGSDLVHQWGGIPTKYLRLHFDEKAVLAAQKSAGVARADELRGLQLSAQADYPTASASQLRELLKRRETPWYSECIVPLLKGLHTGASACTFFLSGPNETHRPEFAPDDILEIACRVQEGAIRRIVPAVPPPQRMAAFVRDFCEHERRAARAVIARDESLVRQALEIHPWIARTAQHRELSARLAELIVLPGAQPDDARPGLLH